MIREQLSEVEERIQAACARSGRRREDVTLIAVSKTKPKEVLMEAYGLGVRIFGENRFRRRQKNMRHCPGISTGI